MLSTCTALVHIPKYALVEEPYEQIDSAEELVYVSEHIKLVREHDELDHKLKDLKKIVAGTLDELETRCERLGKTMQLLQLVLHEVKQYSGKPESEGVDVGHVINAEMPAMPDESKPQRENVGKLKDDLKAFSGDTNVSKDAKWYYRQIAKKCHPDATSDPERNEIFHEAAELAARNDVDMLRTIYEHLQTKKSWKRNRWKQKLELARRRYTEVAQQTSDYLQSESVAIHNAYLRGQVREVVQRFSSTSGKKLIEGLKKLQRFDPVRTRSFVDQLKAIEELDWYFCGQEELDERNKERHLRDELELAKQYEEAMKIAEENGNLSVYDDYEAQNESEGNLNE